MRFCWRSAQARRVVHLGVLLLVAVVAAGEEFAPQISMVPTPSRAAIGSDALVTWTISDTLPSGALVDVAPSRAEVRS